MKKMNAIQLIAILTLIIIPVFGSINVKASPEKSSLYQAIPQPWRHVSSFTGDSIAMLNPNDGWSILNAGKRAFLHHWNGKTWQLWGEITHSQDIVRSDIHMISETDGWIVLGGPIGQEAVSVIYRWDGNSWTIFETLTDPNQISLNSLNFVSEIDGWAIAISAFGSYIYHWNGEIWRKVKTISMTENLVDRIYMVSSTDGWVIGESIYRFDGTDWTDSGSPVSHWLNAIDMVSADDGWIVGEEGTILHWDGSNWTSVQSPTTIVLTAISMASSDHGWAIGGEYGSPNVLIHWDGSSWTQVDSPTSANLYDILMISEYDGWLTSSWSNTESYGTFRFNPTNLETNHDSGSVGSYFNIAGEGFPPNTITTISINNQVISTTLSTDNSGNIQFTLNTDSADSGIYYVTVSVNPESATRFILSPNKPQHPLEGNFHLLEVPKGIALQEVYLPLIIK
jgi:hypothetical protein